MRMTKTILLSSIAAFSVTALPAVAQDAVAEDEAESGEIIVTARMLWLRRVLMMHRVSRS
jgi:hypothetical protein